MALEGVSRRPRHTVARRLVAIGSCCIRRVVENGRNLRDSPAYFHDSITERADRPVAEADHYMPLFFHLFPAGSPRDLCIALRFRVVPGFGAPPEVDR